MIIRRERPDDVPAIRSVTAAAFAAVEHAAPPVGDEDVPGEVTLVEWLRADSGWLPELSLVAEVDDAVVGHVVATRGRLGDTPALGLGPLSVVPERQRGGIGAALMHAVLGAADALDEPLVALLGDPGYYGRFGFVAAGPIGVSAPDPAWGDFFQARPLTAYAGQQGTFTYAEPFDRL